MKAAYYRPTPVLASHLELQGEDVEKFPVYKPPHKGELAPGWPEFRVVPAGFVIDHPECWKLVKIGTAKPADEECKEAAGMTPEQMVRRYQRQKLLEAGKLTGDPKFDAP
ncbi:MAG: hypothetical protein E6Q97_06480 [Desulfurellales bacterium]|nr:MAG: hypothetical protein E6Q97_06480 [Desulfurellales bacterium]